jgi:phosphohistidine phosphatase
VRRLWLLRHAKSSWDDDGLADHERPLALRGLKAGKRVARWAERNGVRPGLVLCSTAVRARATLDLVLPGLGRPDVALDDRLYHASAGGLLTRVQEVDPDIRELLLIGHNPGLHDLACLLAPPGPDAFPTGALAELQLAVSDWGKATAGCATVGRLVLPRSLD